MVSSQKNRREAYFFRETLSSVCHGLLGTYTTIDLQNEAAIYGKISSVSGYMDIELTNCIFKNPMGTYYPFDTFYVKSRNIRYIHMPTDCTAISLIKQTLEPKQPSKPKPNKKKVYKLKRAERYQQEILQELASKQK